MTSSLYRGRVRHTRLRPSRHDFSYRVFYGLFDIDEFERLDRRLHLFSFERFNLFSLRASDHGPDDGTPLRRWADEVLGDAGVDLEGGRVMLLAFPRVFGYVFNPISVWYCFGPDEGLRAVIHEVRNTFGDKHMYVVPLDSAGLDHAFAKALHVSPFMDMDATYRFAMNVPDEHLTVGIRQHDDDGPLFRAALTASRMPFTDRNLLRLFFTHPLVTIKAITAIHWEALHLWRKGAGFRRRPEAPERSVTVVTPVQEAT
jgi:DUF1365 family protein